MKKLSSLFAIDLCAYAVMNNHYHFVVRIDQQKAIEWSEKEVAERWTQIFSAPLIIERWLAGDRLGHAEQIYARVTIGIWRKRLFDLSWFMRCLNEPIARMANKEENCTGRFWEGRFKSQALLDERAVLACMAYVDLNPIRAAIANSPERSDFTSIQDRIMNSGTCSLYPFVGQADGELGIPFDLNDYMEMVDWAGRVVRNGKKGYIPKAMPPILSRLGLPATPVLEYVCEKQRFPVSALGSARSLRAFAKGMGMKFIKGISLGKRICPEPG
jgi:REP element-mobilizing transposase RayT